MARDSLQISAGRKDYSLSESHPAREISKADMDNFWALGYCHCLASHKKMRSPNPFPACCPQTQLEGRCLVIKVMLITGSLSYLLLLAADRLAQEIDGLNFLQLFLIQPPNSLRC